MSVQFNEYLTKQLRRYMTIVVLGTTVFFMILSIFLAHSYTRHQLKKDNQLVKNVLHEDYYRIVNKIRKIDKQSTDDEFSSKSLISEFYQLRSDSTMKFNFTIMDHDFDVIATNLYKGNIEELQASKELKSALRQFETLNINKVADGPISTYSTKQQTVMTLVFQTNQFLYVIEPLRESFIDLEHQIKSNLIVVDHYDNVLFDTSANFQDSVHKFKVSNSDYSVLNDEVDLFRFITVKQKIVTSSIIVYTFLTAITTLFVLIQLLIPLNKKLAKSLDEPLNELLDAIEINKNGNLNYYIESHHFVEFDKIYTEFNDLLKNTKELMIRNEELLLMKQEMEMKHLKSQFNPHFMYNSLESIRYEVIFNPQNASDMLLSLGRLMHYSLEKTEEFVILRTDLEFLEDYLKLQKMRFKDRLNYKIHLEDGLSDVRIPKLVIQPLIENSIKHNMDRVYTLNIMIEILKDYEKLYFIVSDDGVGMDEEKMSIIQDILDKPLQVSDHIGLYNINRRLKLLYGKEYGVTLRNQCGLQVIVTLPLNRDEND